MSDQDDTLMEHFFSFIAGSGGEFGPRAARDMRRIFARARATGNAASFGGYVGRLLMEDAAAHGWL